ncbi:DUF3078 domain-containing protein [Mangrovibacterium lignilyticum]|uniref:DUF3078 domain-containing protein n=1 Tax=Mangrovibacterium lignilyticum TaxID=2668052 RepID=UPI0013D8329A|nr:DUF3078 domain-containing protein [Mangrovibacterium lignilyticum]
MKVRFILFGILIVLGVQNATAFDSVRKDVKGAEQDSVKASIDYLNYFLSRKGHWFPQSYEMEHRMRGLIHYLEDEKVDSLMKYLSDYQANQQRYFFRTPDNVEDSLSVPGYTAYPEVQEQLKRIDRSVRGSIIKKQIPVPEQLLENIDDRANVLSQEESYRLLGTEYVSIPDSLASFGALPDSVMTSPDDFRRLQRMDSTKRALLEDARQEYNQLVIKNFVDSISDAYREEYIKQYSLKVQREFSDSIRYKNYRLLSNYNEQVIVQVNDSIDSSLRILKNYINAEQLSFWFHNSAQDSVQVMLSNSYPGQSRLFVKNEQNDSLGIRIQSLDRNSVRMLIDDGVTLTRFSQRQKKDISFEPLRIPSSLDKVDKRFNVITPWVLGSDINFGFTQTYLSNWKKGGKSALATLLVIKGFANYTSEKTTWENSIEMRNGWLKPADDGIQKNDDKFEFITRYGIQAYKKWYYSAEIDFETQLFRGYDYPDRTTVLSGFLSPAKTLIKLGMDYKPKKELSVFISPLTLKSVFVKDTARIDQTNYGVAENKRRFREPGLNMDIAYKKNITTDISWQTKYKMFLNYGALNKYDVDWENTFNFQLSNYINMQALIHLLYDDNVTFPTSRVDAEGNTIYKAKWQFKEFITIGFTYKLNKPIYKRERLN